VAVKELVLAPERKLVASAAAPLVRAIRSPALVVSVPKEKVEEPDINGFLNPYDAISVLAANVFGTIHTNELSEFEILID